VICNALRWTHRCRPLLAMHRCARSVSLTTPHFAARCCTALIVKRTTAEGDAATAEVIESTPHKEASTNFLLIWLSCFARSSLNGRMKTSAVTNRSRAVQILLSLLCAGFLGLSLGGCAGTYYADASATPESRYNTYYGPYYYPYYPWYAYYGGAYNYGVIR